MLKANNTPVEISRMATACHSLAMKTGNYAQMVIADIQRLQDEISRIGDKPMIDGREWWKEGKYLYICHPPTGNGSRPRTYIGADPAAIATAREKIQRKREYECLKADLSARVRDFNRFYHDLQNLSAEISKLTKQQGPPHV